MEAIENAIGANLAALHQLLGDAVRQTREAVACIEAKDRKGTIFSVIDLDRILKEAEALHTAAIALHRHTPF